MIIVRYLLKEITVTLFVIILALLLIIFSNQFVNALGNAASGGITLMAVLRLMILQVPEFLSYLLSMGLFLSILVSLGQLYANQEMTVLSACGFSQLQLLKWIMLIAIPVCLLTAWLLLELNPKIDFYQIKMTHDATNVFSVDKLFPKRFQGILKSGWVLYADSESKESVDNVFLAKHYMANRDYPKGYWDIIKADHLTQEKIKVTEKEFILLEKGSSYHGQPGMKNYRIAEFDKSAMELSSDSVVVQDKQKAHIATLTKLLKSYHQDRKMAVELNWRLSVAFSTLILAMLAVPLSHLNPRQGRYAKVFYALLICLFYINMMYVSRGWTQDGTVNVILGLWWIHGLMLMVAIGLFMNSLGYFRKS